MMKNTLRWLRWLLISATLIGLILPSQITHADGQTLPHYFWGNLTHSDGSPAAIGVVVSALVNGQPGGSTTTFETGKYGYQYKGSNKFMVQGDFVDGDVIRFYVNGILASPTYTFHAGEETHLDLSYTPPTHQFYGKLTHSDGEKAPAGMTVSAVIKGQIYASLVTTQPGVYGGPGENDPKLTIQDDVAENSPISFYVNGILASPAYQFENGSLTQLDLTYSPPRHQFYGSISRTNGGKASAGVTIYAKINGRVYASLTTSEAGKYGGAGDSFPKLTIQDDIAEGTVVTFFVNNCEAVPTYTFSGSGVTEFNLTYTPPVHQFYGTITRTTGGQAPAGVIVSAKINGTQYASLTTTEAGTFGGSGAGAARLVIQDDILDGTPINFFINNRPAAPAYDFTGGAVTDLKLSYTPPAHKFYGTVTKTDGGNAPRGVTIYAKVNGQVYASLLVTEAGKYGGPEESSPRLTIQDDLPAGALIYFYVNNIQAKQSAAFTFDQLTELNLTYTQSSGGGGTGEIITTTPTPTATPTTTTTTTTLPPATTTSRSLEISVNGNTASSALSGTDLILKDLIVKSPDADIQLNIPAGTHVIAPSGTITRITIEALANPPAPPVDKIYVGPVYQCEPGGTTFDPPVSLVVYYQLPAKLQASDLKVGVYTSGAWTLLDPTQYAMDTAAHKISIGVSHFSLYALLAPAAATTTSTNTPAVSTTPAQTGVPTATITAITTVTTTVPAEAGFKWWIILIIAVLVIILVFIVLIVRKKRSLH
jgi:hypothetical protein